MTKLLPLITVFLSLSAMCYAQDGDTEQAKHLYRRSSLCTILMDEENMPKRGEIIKAFLEAPIPDKFNDHNIEVRIFDPSRVRMTEQERQAYDNKQKAENKTIENLLAQIDEQAQSEPAKKAPKKKGGGFGRFLKGAATVVNTVTSSSSPSSNNSTVYDKSAGVDYAGITQEHLLEQAISKQLFDKWFLDCDGNFSMDLVKERGKYDASQIDVLTAKSSTRGIGLLEDAGEELINNTFVVASRYRYVSKEELVDEISGVAKEIAQATGDKYVTLAAGAAQVTLSASMGTGYYVYITSFLFQLDWCDDIAHSFYTNLWDNHKEYEASDIFSLKYIGEEKAFANVKAGIFTDKGEAELVRIATINATDAVLAKLEKKYEKFRTKTPLYSVSPLSAQIGLKEGIEKGDKYEVLEQVIDKNTGRTKYVKKGELKVSGDQIWDNRYMADEENKAAGKEQTIQATYFEGNANGLYPGMLLRQIK